MYCHLYSSYYPFIYSVFFIIFFFFFFFFFFFSSRRRHTRSKRDWSSDVCSSDLNPRPRARSRISTRLQHSLCDRPCASARRSEERRVGKECRSRWWTEH